MSNSKTFRLFLSSTFNDMRAERDELQKKVFPKIRAYCEQEGFSFQPIDLRWGVSFEAGFDQKTMQICIDEVKRCKNALNPNFAIMLGERYGWVPLPASVEAIEFEQVKDVILNKYAGDSKQVKYINQWYKKDTNAIPAQYLLQTRIKEEDKEWKYWGDVEATLRDAFKSAIENELKTILTNEQKDKYIKSATEQEIVEGLFDNEAIAKKDIYFYSRDFTNLDSMSEDEFATLEAKDKIFRKEIEEHNSKNPKDKKAAYEITVKHFSDFENATENRLDENIRPFHQALQNKIKSELPAENTKEYKLTLNTGLARTQDSVTQEHLDKFCADFEETIFSSLKKEIERYKAQDVQDPNILELEQQKAFKEKKSKIFVGREDFIAKVAAYISDKETTSPLVIHADSGSGKSALMAKVLSEAQNKYTNTEETTIAYRFVGTSELSSTPINLYKSLYNELIKQVDLKNIIDEYIEKNVDYFIKKFQVDDKHKEDKKLPLVMSNIKESSKTLVMSDIKMSSKALIMRDIKELSKALSYLFEHCPEDKQLIFFIDALDQFMLSDRLEWLPRTLPHNVSIIISTLPGTYQGIDYLLRLKQKYKGESHFLFLEAFSSDEASSMIDETLEKNKKTVTPSQKEKILEAFNQSCSSNQPGSPLYLKVLLEEAYNWNSYTDVDKEKYPKNLDELITRLFNRLHTHSYHSLPVINNALAYIACSKDGLPEAELFDILSQEKEKEIIDDVSNKFYPRPHRVPTAIWARLYSEISHYLSIKKVDGVDQISFFHRKFNEGAYRLNLNFTKDKDNTFITDKSKQTTKEDMHARLANFYEIVYKQDKKELEKLNIGASLESALTELPYQLIMSNQKEKSLQLLTDFEFLMKKFKLNRAQEVMEDYALAKAEGMNSDPNLKSLNEKFYIFDNFITSNKDILKRGNKDWDSSKIFFQLSIEHGDDSPLSIDAEKYQDDGKVNWDYLKDVNRREKYIIDPLSNIIQIKDDIQSIKIENNNLSIFTNKSNLIYDKNSFIKIDELDRIDAINTQKKDISKLDGVETHKNYIKLKNGDLFCYGGLIDRDVVIRDAKTLEKKATIKGHGGSPVYLQELSNGDIATVSCQRAFRILRDYKEVYKLDEIHNDEVLGFSYDEEKNELITYSKDNTIKQFEIDLKYNPLEQENLKNMALCHDYEEYILTSGIAINKIARDSYKIVDVYSGHDYPFACVVKINEQYFAAASFDKKIFIFDIHHLKVIKILEFFNETIFIPLLSTIKIDDKYLIFANFGQTAYLLDENLNTNKVNKDDYKEQTKYQTAQKNTDKEVFIESERLKYKNLCWYSDKNQELKFTDEQRGIVCIKDGKKSIKFLKIIQTYYPISPLC